MRDGFGCASVWIGVVESAFTPIYTRTRPSTESTVICVVDELTSTKEQCNEMVKSVVCRTFINIAARGDIGICWDPAFKVFGPEKKISRRLQPPAEVTPSLGSGSGTPDLYPTSSAGRPRKLQPKVYNGKGFIELKVPRCAAEALESGPPTCFEIRRDSVGLRRSRQWTPYFRVQVGMTIDEQGIVAFGGSGAKPGDVPGLNNELPRLNPDDAD